MAESRLQLAAEEVRRERQFRDQALKRVDAAEKLLEEAKRNEIAQSETVLVERARYRFNATAQRFEYMGELGWTGSMSLTLVRTLLSLAPRDSFSPLTVEEVAAIHEATEALDDVTARWEGELARNVTPEGERVACREAIIDNDKKSDLLHALLVRHGAEAPADGKKDGAQ